MDGALRYDREEIAEGEDSLSSIARRIRSGATVLDLGTATGRLGAFLKTKRGCTVDGVESEAKAAEIARPHYRTHLHANLERIRLAEHFPAHAYDAIICADVLEHLVDPGAVLDQLADLLAPDGRVLISIPNVGYAGIVAGLLGGEFQYRPTGLLDETHLRFFTRKSLLALLEQHGFGARSIEPLQLEVRHTEFKDGPFEKLPPRLMRAILDAPDALTYQFLVEAAPGVHADTIAQALRLPAARAEVQLYWAGAGEGFDGARCLTTLVAMDETAAPVKLTLPSTPGPVRLRFDVGNRPGYLRLHSLEIRSGGGETVWAWDGDPQSLPVRHELEVFHGSFGRTWLATGGDPFVELPVTAPPGSVFVAAMDWPGSQDDALALDVLRSVEARADAQNEVSQRRMEKLEQRLESMAQRAAGLEMQLQHANRSLHALVGRIVTLEQQGRARKLVRTARSTFLRQRIAFDAVPIRQLREAAGEWESIGSDPSFDLRPRGGRFPSGWVKLEIELEVAKWSKPATLYVDSGKGYEETGILPLPPSRAGRVEAIVKLPYAVYAMRLDPLECPGRLKLGAVVMQEMGKAEVGVRGLLSMTRSAVRDADLRRPLMDETVKALRERGVRGLLEELRDHARGETRRTYADWVSAFDTLSEGDRDAIAERIHELPAKPLISIVMPVYDTPEEWLRRAVESVKAQLYPHWELCIADDSSKAGHIRPLLASLAEGDKRIKLTLREQNGHIAAASNSALELAAGDFVALLDHDDELAPHALYMLAEELAAHPDADLIYSDEDKIDGAGRRYDPHFKPDWNPDLLDSVNYVAHLACLRTSLVRNAGGFRNGTEGSQDYDLFLRATRLTAPSRIRHLPHVLYHWRSIHGSTAAAPGNKSYAVLAAEKALRDSHPGCEVAPGPFPTTYRVRHPLPAAEPLVSIVMPTRNGRDLVERAIDSIRAKTTYGRYEIVLVDNQSDDPQAVAYFEQLQRSGHARVVKYDAAFNYSAINNFAVREARGDLVCLLNNDVEVIEPGWLSELVSHAVRPEIGAVGCKLLYPDGKLQHAGVILGLYGVAGHIFRGEPGDARGYYNRAQLTQNLSAVTAACLMVRKSVYQEVGGLDETNLRIAFNDVDFCLRILEKGYRNLYTPYAVLYHHESASRGYEDTPEKQARFQKEVEFMLARWGELLVRDPAYNQNLTLEGLLMELCWPPRATKPWLKD